MNISRYEFKEECDVRGCDGALSSYSAGDPYYLCCCDGDVPLPRALIATSESESWDRAQSY